METEPEGRPIVQEEEYLESVYPGPLVFTGSSENDVALAKQFWISASMHPHPESRLVSSSARQRLPVARAIGRPTKADKYFDSEYYKIEELMEKNRKAQEAEEKQKYIQKAKKREEILNLLRKRREERIEKELISLHHKPNAKVPQPKKVLTESERRDREEVRALGP